MHRVVLFLTLIAAYLALNGRPEANAATTAAAPWDFQVVAQTGQNGLVAQGGVSLTDNGGIYFVGQFDTDPILRLTRWQNGQLQPVTLPDGVKLLDFGSSIYATPAGDIVFRGTCAGIDFSSCILKADGTVVRVETGTMFPSISFANNGYWLLLEQLPDSVTRVATTNGVIQTPAVEIKTFLQTADVYEVRYVVDVAPDGAVLIFEFISTAEKSVSRLKFVGARDEVIVEKETTPPGGPGEQLEVPAGVNELGDLLYSVSKYTEAAGGGLNSSQSLYIQPHAGGAASKVLEQNSAFRSFDWPMQLANNHRTVYRAYDLSCDGDYRSPAAFSCHPYFTGFNLASDKLEIPLVDLFGIDGNLNGAPQLSASGDFLVASVSLADGSAALVMGGARHHWANPGGGSWETAVNWSPNGIPSGRAQANFDLPNSYAVTLGNQRSGSVSVSAGDVTFRNGTLTVSPFNLAVANPSGTADIPRLTIGEVGSSTYITANISVGPGELQLNNAFVVAPESDGLSSIVELGVIGSAAVTATNASTWGWQNMHVGALYPAQLRLEKGSFMGNIPAQEMVIGSGPAVNNGIARVTVDDVDNHPGQFGIGTALGASIINLKIGQGLIGELALTNGGSAFVINAFVGIADHGNRTDGSIIVSGVNAARPSTFEAGSDSTNEGGLFAATAVGTDAQIELLDGGLMQANFLSLAAAPQSSALMFVDGVNGTHRSTLFAPVPEGEVPPPPNPSAGLCVVGYAGQGTLNVSNGGLMECRNIAVGYLPGSEGEMNIGGFSGAYSSQVIARASTDDDGLVCIGSVLACGQPGTGARGGVVLTPRGLLEGELVLVGTNGRIRGSGTVFALQGVLVGGRMSPGIQVLTPFGPLSNEEIGALTIQGNLTVSNTGEIALDIWGKTAELQDSMVVTGTVGLNGRLLLSFGNGYAPQTGDKLPLIQAGAFSGTPSEVVIAGLEDGFEYELAFSDGMLTLTALNDGVPTTGKDRQAVYLPLVVR